MSDATTAAFDFGTSDVFAHEYRVAGNDNASRDGAGFDIVVVRAQVRPISSESTPKSFLEEVTILVLTWNEAPNIGRTLSALTAFPNIVVLDSGSTDETASIVSRFPNARLVTRRFDSHAAQWNFGLTSCEISTRWLLALDADYVLTGELIAEIASLSPPKDVNGYRMSFSYCIDGVALSATLYPPVMALFRRDMGHYEQSGHTQRLVLRGSIEDLRHKALHDDRKPLGRWLQSQISYARLEAQHLATTDTADLRLTDKVRKCLVVAPFLVFFHTLFVKGCIRDGWRGCFYALQRVLAECLISLELLDWRLRGARK